MTSSVQGHGHEIDLLPRQVLLHVLGPHWLSKSHISSILNVLLFSIQLFRSSNRCVFCISSRIEKAKCMVCFFVFCLSRSVIEFELNFSLLRNCCVDSILQTQVSQWEVLQYWPHLQGKPPVLWERYELLYLYCFTFL